MIGNLVDFMEELKSIKTSIDKITRTLNYQSDQIEQQQKDLKELQAILSDMFENDKFKKSNVYQTLYNRYYIRIEAILDMASEKSTDARESVIPGLFEPPELRHVLPYNEQDVA